VQTTEWNSWKEFCVYTNREGLWAEKFKDILDEPSVLLDVGCGTGEFASSLQGWAKKVIGIDIVDYRVKKDFNFSLTSIENYTKETPDVIVYKQSFHLIPHPFNVQHLFPNATIVLMQMCKPYWEKDPIWNLAPYNIYENKNNFEELGYTTLLYNEAIEFQLDKEVYKRLTLGGFTSDLRKLSQEERQIIWNTIEQNYNNIYSDKLDILIATPQ
jgi:SAM-dependent methyltransferase